MDSLQPLFSSREEEVQQSFYFDQWLHQNAQNRQTVFSYFKQSPYYDRDCSNELIEMQGQTDAYQTQLTGIQYEVVCDGNHQECAYYQIYKCNRISPTESELLMVYFIIGSNVEPDGVNPYLVSLPLGMTFPMPDQYQVMTRNTSLMLYHCQQIIQDIGLLLQIEKKMISPNTGQECSKEGGQHLSDVTFNSFDQYDLFPVVQSIIDNDSNNNEQMMLDGIEDNV